jgi:hypothetical protein
MDSLAIAGIVSGITGILIAVYTHVKHSSCFGITIDTYSPSEIAQQPQPQNIIINTPHNTPELKHSNESSI